MQRKGAHDGVRCVGGGAVCFGAPVKDKMKMKNKALTLPNMNTHISGLLVHW